MTRLSPFLCLALVLLLAACTSTRSTSTPYERDELVSVHFNKTNDYTLLVYRDGIGQKRHVLRRAGVFEMMVTYTFTGDVKLLLRGDKERVLESHEAQEVTLYVNDVIHAKDPIPSQATSI